MLQFFPATIFIIRKKNTKKTKHECNNNILKRFELEWSVLSQSHVGGRAWSFASAETA
jgi:hypothetical protein